MENKLKSEKKEEAIKMKKEKQKLYNDKVKQEKIKIYNEEAKKDIDELYLKKKLSTVYRENKEKIQKETHSCHKSVAIRYKKHKDLVFSMMGDVEKEIDNDNDLIF